MLNIDRFIKENRLYSVNRIKNTDIVQFDTHMLALPVWGAMSSIMRVPLNLISFDYHTDTHAPFAAAVCSSGMGNASNISLRHPVIKSILENKKYRREDFDFDDVVGIAVKHLRNDEHICTADMLDYLKSYTIICNEDTDEAKDFQNQDRYNGYDATYYSKYDIDSIRLSVQSPIVLDFDLDYFNSRRDFSEAFIKMVNPLIKRAEVITVAREPKFFEMCKTDDDFELDEALSMLISIIENALS